MRRLVASAFVGVACVLGGARPARAEVRETAQRLVDEWRRAGGEVAMGAPRFINEGEAIVIDVPAGAQATCVTVALVGARGASFHARTSDAAEDSEDPEEAAQSAAGALSIARCGGDEIVRLVVTSDGGRGALETVVARSRAPLPALRVALPERTGGVLPPSPEAGDLPALPPPERRADLAEQRARRDGGTVQARGSLVAGPDGAGTGKIVLTEGCHRIELFARDVATGRPGRKTKLDLDAEMRDDEGERLLSRDRSDAADAHLETCVGETTRAKIVFAGSPPGEPLVMSRMSWPLPARLPIAWGAEVRARMAEALLARSVESPRRDAVFLAQGGSGDTPVPIAVEPGACYVAVVAVAQGTPRGIGLRALVGARESIDDRSTSDSAGVVSLCAGEARRALLEVEARGTGVGWALAVYRVQGAVWEPPR
jgi:hypothetical protein